MNKESLEIVQDKIADLLNTCNIPTHEKVELLIDLMHFLNPDMYAKNIEILNKELKLTKKEEYDII